jgi:small GTP-binding protein
MNLREYEQAKFKLSELVQSAAALIHDQKNQTLEDRVRDLLVRLAEDRFNLTMVGRFSRGKSSLLNAILGTDRLPTGIVPLTSVITAVSYGSSEKVTVKYRERRLDSEITLEELPRYITEQGNPGNSLGVAIANIEVPAEILRRGFHFVDTPGLGSAITENTLTTQAFLPEVDALLLVTSFESPLSEDERARFDDVSHAGLPVFVVVNKHDLATAADRAKVLEFVRSHLSARDGQSSLEIFSVSARDGLLAKRSKDLDLLQSSGLPALEERLVHFLIDQKQSVFLSRMRVRIEDFFRDLPPFDGVETLRQRANHLLDECPAIQDGSEAASVPEPPIPAFSRNQLSPCQICTEIEDATWNFLARYQYELSTDLESQAEFSRRSGFCCHHTWEYQRLASSYGTCAGYPPLLERIAVSLRTVGAGAGDPRRGIEDLLPTRAKCVACASRDSAEAHSVRQLAERLRKDPARELDNLSALCLPHLSALSEAVDDPEIGRALASHLASTFERIAEDMRRFTLKRSAARRQLETTEEQTAAERALMLVTGRPGVNSVVGRNPEL